MSEIRVAVLDDWQGVAQSSTNWSPLMARAAVVFFPNAFHDQDDAVDKHGRKEDAPDIPEILDDQRQNCHRRQGRQ